MLRRTGIAIPSRERVDDVIAFFRSDGRRWRWRGSKGGERRRRGELVKSRKVAAESGAEERTAGGEGD
jgi:hypothetical protein